MSSEGIRVAVRVRPPMVAEAEKHGGVSSHQTHLSSATVVADTSTGLPWSWTSCSLSCKQVINPNTTGRLGTPQQPPQASQAGQGRKGSVSGEQREEFRFSYVFDPAQTTDVIYNQVARPIVRSVLQGYDGCIFAYGQTGSGKTHTISGTPEQPGVLPLAVNEIFGAIDEFAADRHCVLRIAFLELYNEVLRDLLTPDAPTINIVDDGVHGVTLPNVRCLVVTSLEEVQQYIAEGQQRRVTGANMIHEHASRSHAIYQFTFEMRQRGDHSKIIQSVLNIVDLAGSETNYQLPTDSHEVVTQRAMLGDLGNAQEKEDAKRKVAQRNLEGSNIRKSLLALVRCVDVLSSAPAPSGREAVARTPPPDGEAKAPSPLTPQGSQGITTPLTKGSNSAPFVPFRDSKLTRLLRSALSGNSTAAVLCTINPKEEKETMNSLRFAAKTQRIAKGPRSVIVVDEKGTVLQRLEAELEAARQKMMDAEGKNQSLIENLSHQLEGAEKERQAELERAEALRRKCENLERLFLSSKKGDRGTNSRSTATEGKAQNRADALYRRTWSAPPTFKRLVLRAHTSAVGSAAPHDYSDVAVNRAQYDPTLPAPFDQLDAMNQTAISLAQDEMTKAMLKAQREKIEKLEPLAADRGAKEIARLEAVLAEKESEHQAKLSQMEKALKEMEDKIKTLQAEKDKMRKEAIQFAQQFEVEKEALLTMPTGLCGAKDPRRGPPPPVDEIAAKYPQLK